MPEASDFLALTPSLSLWQAFDPAVKSDLFATAVATATGLFLIDPIPLASSALAEMVGTRKVVGIMVTNANHIRSAQAFADRFGAPVFSAAPVAAEFPAACSRPISDGEEIGSGVFAIALPGAAPGEVAFHFAEEGGTMVAGDALINFEPYGFTFLPPKYCANQKEMRRSLRRLLDRDFQRLFFAHGTPILTSARERLAALLQ